jgi:hypothetical protein
MKQVQFTAFVPHEVASCINVPDTCNGPVR